MLIYCKVRDVKDPVRAHKTDAGVDLFIPNDFQETVLKVGDSILVPSGIKIKLPENTAGIFFNKSGIAKKGLIVGAQVVDEQYSGEIHIQLIKVTGDPVTIKPGDKVAQLLVMPVFYCNLVQYNEQQYAHSTSEFERKEKCFGSTNS